MRVRVPKPTPERGFFLPAITSAVLQLARNLLKLLRQRV